MGEVCLSKYNFIGLPNWVLNLIINCNNSGAPLYGQPLNTPGPPYIPRAIIYNILYIPNSFPTISSNLFCKINQLNTGHRLIPSHKGHFKNCVQSQGPRVTNSHNISLTSIRFTDTEYLSTVYFLCVSSLL